MESYVFLAVQFAFHVICSHANSVAVFTNATDIISGCSIAGCYSELLEARRHLILPRYWTIGTPVPQSNVISEVIKLFKNHSTEPLKVIIYSDCLRARQKESLYKELEDHTAILRHVQWIILSNYELEGYSSWSSRYPSLSCDAVFVTWPSLNIFDVSELRYAAVCTKRKKLTTASYLTRQEPLPLWNVTIRSGCRVGGSPRYCRMPLYIAVTEALKVYSARLESTQSKKDVDLGLANDMSFFTGTLGELQNRTFDLYLVELAQEWKRLQTFDYMKTTEVQSLTFAFALPASAPSADASFFSAGSFGMTAVAAFAIATTVILLKMENYRSHHFIWSATSLTVLLVFLLFSQPLNPSVTNIQKKGQVLKKTHKRRAKETPERRMLAVRAVLAIWLFASVIFLTGLKSSLISQLKYPLVAEPIDSVAKLEVALGNNAIAPCLLKGTGAAEYLMQPEQFDRPICKLIRRHISENGTKNMVEAPSTCFAKMHRGTHVYINFYSALKQLAWSGHKGGIISRDSLVTFFGSCAASRGWPYTRSMRRVTSTVIESGLILKHTRDLDFRNSSMMTAEHVESRRKLMETAGSSLTPLGMLHFKIALCVLGVGPAAGGTLAGEHERAVVFRPHASSSRGARRRRVGPRSSNGLGVGLGRRNARVMGSGTSVRNCNF
ncbi:hypothetical protein HPB47_019280 [Ixodes persulcatus]|uniref:Uncharacterized protein n=1 Tax=Ixodes persulcatus TaxID=34615 RepID=A0AC60QL53_IXOPE|nr:hypothetical protein HPB47_019280 [Ixodes persulcatus]